MRQKLMNLHELTPEEYKIVYPSPVAVYNSVDFALLNSGKAEDLKFLSLYDGVNHRLGIILGLRDGEWRSPFSAPFGGFSCNGKETSGVYSDMCCRMTEYFRGRSVRIVPPPDIYASGSASCGYALAPWADWRNLWEGHVYPLMKFPDFEHDLPSRKARYLRSGMRRGCRLVRSSLDEAYEVVRSHHADKGYPLRMSIDDLKAMESFVRIDSFLLEESGDVLAAAIVYRHGNKLAQVIYWCHLPDKETDYSMPVLASEIFGFYHSEGFEYVDLGPSSGYSDPNPGLSVFKESLGCLPYLKPSYLLR